jgi:hypothetical protein
MDRVSGYVCKEVEGEGKRYLFGRHEDEREADRQEEEEEEGEMPLVVFLPSSSLSKRMHGILRQSG